MQKFIGAILTLMVVLVSCKETKEPLEEVATVETIVKPPVLHYGFNLDDYNVVHDTVRNGDSFGELMLKNKVDYPKIAAISEKFRDTFDVRKIQVGKPYVILKSKDTSEVAEVFIYQNDRINYTVVDLRDSTNAYKSKKKVKLVEREIGGVIENNLSMTIDTLGVDYNLTFALADIYAWTIDFGRLDPGDKFKVVFEERYINDSIYAGIGSVKAAYFVHKGKPIYAFPYLSDATNNILEYFDQDANNLRSTFLRAPVKLQYRLSSRYNLRRRIAYYGNKVRPHRGTDFAAPIGTPIVATADGTVTESTRRGGNGKYVKIKHNGTYSTQYLHMKAQNVKRGDFVRQGDVIGWIGMTGNTGGPHVCYRFWKNGRQVDPFKEELPAAEPIADSLRTDYLAYIQPLRDQLDCIELIEATPELEENLITYNP
ncbi:peptidoglycan DD-metalloendopeptidase family protein [Flagellimonas zhangzhouensis]|uniref:Murein DD-endopeptidase MepM and murein hydrolase activator NlpD, contain LysM domain n=1 Tax=Flagellimonas zhangzhouensis TaxID=1073328 RepID=A0A1H2V6U8_9FLAO|nr:peptidoglycan DD-metalloendopeptidase family protein [Allomuricauda zhangzhouensis]SDQ10229.1 Murein DD-endopeptidase MepM and murein hydrolase activator NlpD, contain LysM domain [Allomuricauda zhangzhouensis]SDW64046.1 Murein DD-endopeptidase MepM and murein hydrolase activator NlpD, contain LysM domain [Allomuricauda zhangzhouensis]